MKKSLVVLLLACVVGIALVLWRPSQSNSSKALAMAREACGLEKSMGTWQFVEGKDFSNLDPNNFTRAEQKALLPIVTESAVIAKEAALVDSHWSSLANSLGQIAGAYSRLSSLEYSNDIDLSYISEYRLDAYFTCKALQSKSVG